MSYFPIISDKSELEAGTVLAPRFNGDGLVSAIVQDLETGEILMLAHMNADALQKTIDTGQTHFWSRSRQELWHKGATSGDYQNVNEIFIDCDQDAILIKVTLAGKSACHTGRKSCFYRKIEKDDGSLRLAFEE